MPKKRAFTYIAAVCLVVVLVSGFSFAGNPPKNPSHEETENPSRLHIAAGTLYTAEGVPIALHGVTATIQKITPKGKPASTNKGEEGGKPAADPEMVTVDSGSVYLSDASLSKLMNQKIGPQGKVHNLKLTTDKSQLKITGDAKKAIDVPFTLQGPVKPTANGQIELDAKSVKAADIPGLAQLLGFTVQNAVGNKAAKGVTAKQNTIIFNPDELWGLPVHGKVTGVHVEPHGLVLVFGGKQSPKGKIVRTAAHHQGRAK